MSVRILGRTHGAGARRVSSASGDRSSQGTGIREVSASARSLIPCRPACATRRWSLLPDGEEILDVICGDKDFWVISATHNIAHVKPAKEGAATNLNLVTTSGAVYSFLLTEKGGAGTARPEGVRERRPRRSAAHSRSTTAPHRSRNCAGELSSRQAAQRRPPRRQATEAIAAYQQQYPGELQFVYGTPKYAKPFLVRSIWHDGQFTYIKADATELPALYEVKDGKPALLNFQVQNGTYVVPKVLDRGYLALGKERFDFAQQGR